MSHLWPKIVDLETAVKASRQGIWAALLGVLITSCIIAYNRITGVQALGIDEWSFLDAFLMVLIAWGIHRKSRFAAFAGLVIYLAGQAILRSEYGGGGIVLTIIFTLMFVNSVRGTFAYHKYIAQAKSESHPDTSVSRKHIDRSEGISIGKFAKVSLLALGIVGLGLIISGAVYTVVGPPTKVVSGEQLKERHLEVIRSLDILEPDEKILFFYTDAFLDIQDEFYVLTDKKVLLHGPDYGERSFNIYFRQIKKIEVYYSDSWIEDSLVGLDLVDGTRVWFPLSNEGSDDQKFVEALGKATGLEAGLTDRSTFYD